MTDMTAEQIAALAAQDTPSATTVQDPVPAFAQNESGNLTPVVVPPVNNEHVEPEEIAAAAAGDLTLEDMQIAMLSATEVTFKNGRSLPIVKFTDANGDQVTSLANATCAHAGDGSISIPLVGVPIAR